MCSLSQKVTRAKYLFHTINTSMPLYLSFHSRLRNQQRLSDLPKAREYIRIELPLLIFTLLHNKIYLKYLRQNCFQTDVSSIYRTVKWKSSTSTNVKTEPPFQWFCLHITASLLALVKPHLFTAAEILACEWKSSITRHLIYLLFFPVHNHFFWWFHWIVQPSFKGPKH